MNEEPEKDPEGDVRMLTSYSKEELSEMLEKTKSRGKKQRIKKILGIQDSVEEETGGVDAPKKRDIKALIKKVEEAKENKANRKQKGPFVSEEERNIH